MKKVSFRLRNFDKEQFLTYNIDNEADLDEEVLNFLEDEEPAGIVPVIFDDSEEDYDTFSYDITDKIHLTELSNQEINAEMVLMVMRGIVISLTNMAEYRIPLSYLVLHRNYIYIDSDYKVEFICIPLEDMDEEVDITGFLRGFLANIRFESSENGDYVAKLLTYINNSAIFKLHNLLTLIEDLMEDYGIEIPEDEETGIYVEYQEVEETVEEPEAVEEPEDNTEEVSGDTTVLTEDRNEESPEDTEEVSEDVTEDEDAANPEDDFEKSEQEVLEESKNEELEEVPEATETIMTEEDDLEKEASQETLDEAKELIDKIKQQVMEEQEDMKEISDEPEEEESEDGLEEDFNNDSVDDVEDDSENDIKKEKTDPKLKQVTGVVLHDELDDFLAEKEMEEMLANKGEPSIKMKKNIKVNRASIVNSNKEELAAEEEEAALEESEEVSGSILSQTIGATGILKGAGTVPKANPYLIRVNTDERIMITKQSFKIGKASMGVDYTVKGNGAVSRVHAIISNKDDVYYIKDNKSTNHTYVNGKVVDEGSEELLTHDSKIMLGDEEFIFKLR